LKDALEVSKEEKDWLYQSVNLALSSATAASSGSTGGSGAGGATLCNTHGNILQRATTRVGRKISGLGGVEEEGGEGGRKGERGGGTARQSKMIELADAFNSACVLAGTRNDAVFLIRRKWKEREERDVCCSVLQCVAAYCSVL